MAQLYSAPQFDFNTLLRIPEFERCHKRSAECADVITRFGRSPQDAVAFLCFYSAATTTDRLAALHALTEKLRGNPDGELMQWRIVRALALVARWPALRASFDAEIP